MLSALMLSAVSCNDAFDDSLLWEKINNHENRIAALEELCKQMNTNITSLQKIVNTLQNNDYVTNVAPITKDGETIGYTITFTKSEPITIYLGKDGIDGTNGKDGKDGHTPIIGVKQDTDNLYYWTVDGEWLLDSNGNKIKAQSVDGEDGKDGIDGTDGTNGTNGFTPRLKIENDYWWVSYDNGSTWEQLDKATGENSDSFFKNVITTDDYIIFTFTDGTELTVPRTRQIRGNKIYYTTSNGEKIFLNSAFEYFGAILVSSIYNDGQGVLIFDDTITKIGNDAFEDCYLLTSITIPDSVTEIGRYAFSGCTSLTRVTIGNSVTEIGESAFNGCTSLANINIPNSVTKIERQAFRGCTSLPIENGIRYADTCAAEDVNIGSIESLNMLKEGTRLIGAHAFYVYSHYYYFTSVTIPDSVISIGDYAFYGSKKLKEVYCKAAIPPVVGSNIFYNKESKPKIYVPTESIDAYKSALGWSEYATTIIGYDFE